jgi:Na+/H+ antiporter NhaD/arsenite permease-like protein
MLIANDMALITFLPLGYFVLKSAGREDRMAFTFTMQTIAANLGGMLTPFGNPQNLYLYNAFSIPTAEFFAIMWKPTLFAIALIAACCFIGKSEEIQPVEEEVEPLNKPKAVINALLFVAMVLLIFRVIPVLYGLLVIPIMLVVDRKALAKVDYPLLLTFCAFFVFTGNIARIDAVNRFFAALLEKSVLLTGALSCQVISNVPSAVLLSKFTSSYRSLLVAVNIGGCGTLISSMASLISFKNFSLYRPKEKGKYLFINTALNFGFLILLIAFCLFFY